MSFARSLRISAMMLAFMFAGGTGSFCQSGPQPIYLDKSQPISRRVEDLLGRMTLKEKVGQLNLPCVYVDGLGKTIQEKIEACKRFAAGTYTDEIGPGCGFFTLADTILHQGVQRTAGKDGWQADKAGAVQLAVASRESSDAGALRGHGAADRVAAFARAVESATGRRKAGLDMCNFSLPCRLSTAFIVVVVSHNPSKVFKTSAQVENLADEYVSLRLEYDPTLAVVMGLPYRSELRFSRP